MLSEAPPARTSTPAPPTVWVLEPLWQPTLSPRLLAPGRIRIGSDPQCELHIPLTGIAGQHALLLAGTRRIILRAWDARTWINDEAVQETTLRLGDRVAIGPVVFRVRLATTDELLTQLPSPAPPDAPSPPSTAPTPTENAPGGPAREDRWDTSWSLVASAPPVVTSPVPEGDWVAAPEAPTLTWTTELSDRNSTTEPVLCGWQQACPAADAAWLDAGQQETQFAAQFETQREQWVAEQRARATQQARLWEERQRELETREQELAQRWRALEQQTQCLAQEQQRWQDERQRWNSHHETQLQKLLEREQEAIQREQQLAEQAEQLAQREASLVQQEQALQARLVEHETVWQTRQAELLRLKQELLDERRRIEQVLAQARQELSEEAARQAQACQEWEQAHRQLTAGLAQQAAQIDASREQLAQRARQLEAEQAACRATRAQLEAELAAFIREQQAFQEERQRWECQRQQLEAELSAVRDDLLRQQTQLVQELKHRTQAETELLTLRRELEEERRLLWEQHTQWLKEREAVWEELSQRRQQLQQELEQQEHQHQLVARLVAALESELAGVQAERAACQAERQALEMERAGLAAARAASEEYQRSLDADRATWQADCLQQAEELRQARQDLTAAQEQLATERAALEELRRSLDAERAAWQADCLQQAEELRQARQDLAAAQEQFATERNRWVHERVTDELGTQPLQTAAETAASLSANLAPCTSSLAWQTPPPLDHLSIIPETLACAGTGLNAESPLEPLPRSATSRDNASAAPSEYVPLLSAPMPGSFPEESPAPVPDWADVRSWFPREPQVPPHGPSLNPFEDDWEPVIAPQAVDTPCLSPLPEPTSALPDAMDLEEIFPQAPPAGSVTTRCETVPDTPPSLEGEAGESPVATSLTNDLPAEFSCSVPTTPAPETRVEPSHETTSLNSPVPAEPDDPLLRLRAELAKMFDLPTLSPVTKPTAPAMADEHAPPAESSSPHSDSAALHPQATTPPRKEPACEGGSQVASAPAVEPVPDLAQVEASAPRGIATPQEDDDESISAYLARMLARYSKTPSAEHPSEVAEDGQVGSTPLPAAMASDHAAQAETNSAGLDNPPPPRPRLDREKERAHLESFRKVANLSARTALEYHGWRIIRSELPWQGLLATLTLGGAVYYLSSPWWYGEGYLARGVACAIAAIWPTYRCVLAIRRLRRCNSTTARLSHLIGRSTTTEKSAMPAPAE